MDLTNGVRNFRGRDAVTNTPASHRISFRHRVDHDGSFAHAVELGHRDVFDLSAFAWIKNVLVDLVREAEGVELDAKSGDEFHLVACENFSRRIIWIANDDRFRLLVERSAQLI